MKFDATMVLSFMAIITSQLSHTCTCMCMYARLLAIQYMYIMKLTDV